jgi:N-acetylglucosaminyl-diphospho-decaprenol L-rhamnosyltransferase
MGPGDRSAPRRYRGITERMTTMAVQTRETAQAERPVEPVAAPAVSILIVTWNSAPWIAQCLESIESAAAGVPCEVLIYDNDSSDATAAVVARSGFDPRDFHRSSSNHGFAAGMNFLLRRARGAYVLALNADSVPEAGSIRTLVDHLDRHPGIAAAAPLLSGGDGSSQHEWQLRTLPTLASIAAEVLLIDKVWPSNPWSMKSRYRRIDLSSTSVVEQPAAAMLMLRREVVDAIGAFDERFAPAWFEDVDYCRRMAAAGMQIDFVPSARAAHAGGASLEMLPFDEFISVWYRNLNRYAKKWFRPSEVELVRWMVICGMLLRIAAVATAIVRPPAARASALRGYRNVLREAISRWSDEREMPASGANAPRPDRSLRNDGAG